MIRSLHSVRLMERAKRGVNNPCEKAAVITSWHPSRVNNTEQLAAVVLHAKLWPAFITRPPYKQTADNLCHGPQMMSQSRY